jgi:hypothetical protein
MSAAPTIAHVTRCPTCAGKGSLLGHEDCWRCLGRGVRDDAFVDSPLLERLHPHAEERVRDRIRGTLVLRWVEGPDSLARHVANGLAHTGELVKLGRDRTREWLASRVGPQHVDAVWMSFIGALREHASVRSDQARRTDGAQRRRYAVEARELAALADALEDV